MKETDRLQSLFKNLYAGNPWLDVTLLGTLESIHYQQAAYKPDPDWNSIWEIVNHVICWRENVLERVNGKTLETPEDNYFRFVVDTSEMAWEHTLKKLQDSQNAWISFLENLQAEALENPYPPNNHSYAEHIHGILQHDAYHLGQIVMLVKHQK